MKGDINMNFKCDMLTYVVTYETGQGEKQKVFSNKSDAIHFMLQNPQSELYSCLKIGENNNKEQIYWGDV